LKHELRNFIKEKISSKIKKIWNTPVPVLYVGTNKDEMMGVEIFHIKKNFGSRGKFFWVVFQTKMKNNFDHFWIERTRTWQNNLNL